MEAIRAQSASAPIRSNGRLAHLWQLPLLLLSLALFGYAAYLFIDPKPGLTIEQKIDVAQRHLKNDRPEAAVEQVHRLLAAEKLVPENEAKLHLMLASGIEMLQKQRKLDIPSNHADIIEHTKLALKQGAKPDVTLYRRLAESYEALGRTSDALENYRKAMAIDPDKALNLQRKVIDLQLYKADTGAAEASLDQYLKDPKLADSEKAWGLGEKSRLLADRGNFVECRALLNEALRMDPDAITQGQIQYRLGYCAWKLGDAAEAERLLRVARDLLRVQHPLDAEAALLLGQILEGRGEAKEAISFFQAVLVSHPDSASAPPARLGRGICRIQIGEDEAGLTDLSDLVKEISAKPSREKYKADTIAGLRQSAAALAARGNIHGALDLLELEQTLAPEPDADFFGRLATIYEKRSEQVDKTIAAATTPAEKIRRGQQVRELLVKAGDASVAQSRKLTVQNDEAHRDALWRGIDLYDRAGQLNQAIATLELFVAENPGSGLAPDALLRLGRAYQAAGLFDKAIASFQRNQFRYPQSLAASKSGVPLAQAYVAKGPESYSKAETALLATIDSPLITPEAEEFRDALFELAQLYHRTNRYEEAVARLQEMSERYPSDARMGQLLFLMADSYRKSAELLKAVQKAPRPASASASASPESDAAGIAKQIAIQAEASAAKRDRLGKARRLYDRVIEYYRPAPPSAELDKLYLRLSHFYRADCLYDNGSYEEAIRLYDAAALRYQDDPSALAAYVQIVNAYCALGKTEEAKAANERAKWLLRRIPPEAFQDGRFSMPKDYWEDWLKWSNSAGMW